MPSPLTITQTRIAEVVYETFNNECKPQSDNSLAASVHGETC